VGLRHTTKHLAIEILIGILCVLAALAYAHARPADANFNWPWIPLVGYTAIVFGYPISRFRSVWRIWSFWATLSLFLLLHTLGFALAFSRIVHNRTLAYYPLLAPIEAGVLIVILGKLFPVPGDRRRHPTIG
jgi:hypothetical protein